MEQIQTDAIKKLTDDNCKLTKREHAYLKPYVVKALCAFIEQSPAFAEAVMKEDKKLSECVEKIKIEGNSLSDLEVYEAAVRYFFPEVRIEFKMQIVMPKSQTSAKILDLKFEDLFKF